MPNPRANDEQTATQPVVRRHVPAWLLSLALHLTAVLVGTLLVRTTYLLPPPEEPQRQTSIVLARARPQTVPQYFDEEKVAFESLAESAAIIPTPAPSAIDNPLTAEPPTSGIDLPERQGSAVAPGVLVIRPSPTAGRGTNPLSGLTKADVAAILAEDAALPREAAPTGPTAKLSLFGSAEAEGRSFVFLIDRSQSMGHEGLGAIAAAAKELALSIGRLGPEHKFGVIAYNQKPVSLAGRELIAATADNKQRLVEFVQSTVAFGATEHELGMFAALRLKPDVIFILTDGGEPELKANQLKSIHQTAAARTTIHCLHFGDGPVTDEESFLAKLAAQNGGSYVYIDMRNR